MVQAHVVDVDLRGFRRVVVGLFFCKVGIYNSTLIYVVL